MCIAASQGSMQGDESVVLQQLCSLGSVLAGGRGDTSAAGGAASAEEEGAGLDSYWGDGNNSRGGSRDDSNGGGDNLLTRWLQPPAAPSGEVVPTGSKVAREGGDGGNIANVPDTSRSSSGGSGGGGSGKRIVCDWAAKALLRKKQADAERGRRLRLQHEQDVVSVSLLAGGGAEGCVGAPATMEKEVTPGSSTSSRGDLKAASPLAVTKSSIVPMSVVVVDEDDSKRKSALGEALPRGVKEANGGAISIPSRSPVSVDMLNARGNPARGSVATASKGGLACGGAGAENDCDSGSDGGSGGGSGGGGTSGGSRSSGTGRGSGSSGVAQEDEYDDDFDFLTDADLQALEQEATKTVAASSQQASQNSSRLVDLTQSDPLPSSESCARNGGATPALNKQGFSGTFGSGASWKAGGARVHGHKSAAAGVSVDVQTAGCKRSGGIGTRPPLSALGPNPKRRDHDQRRLITSATGAAQSAGGAGRQGTPSDNCDAPPRWQHQGRAIQGRASQGRVGQGPTTPRIGLNSEIGAGHASNRKILTGREGGDGAAAMAAAAQTRAAANRLNVFTTNDSMEEFTRSTATVAAFPPRGDQRDAVPGKEQGNLVGGAKQPMPPLPPAGNLSVKGDPSVLAGAAPFVPALVHRRFLVLEVTYASASRGNGSREKMLMALEQSPERGMTADNPCLVGGIPADGGGDTGVEQQQRKITLLGDWYDCEVEPGDVVHVLFPVAPCVGGASSSTGNGKVGAAGGWEKALVSSSPLRVGDGRGKEASSSLSSLDIIVDNASGRLLVVQPDILVSPTKVAETVLCARRAVLQSRLASDASKSKPAVLGNLKHELFEKSLLSAAAAAVALNWTALPRQGRGIGLGTEQQSPAGSAAAAWQGRSGAEAVGRRDLLTSQYMSKLVDDIVVSQLEALYGSGLDEDAARRELLSVSGPILNWHRSFIAGGGGAHRGNGGGGAGGGGEGGFASLGSDGVPAARVVLSRVLATEDDVWSPVLGLKGIMDATVEAIVEPLIRSPHHGRPLAVTGLPAGGVPGGGGARPLVMPVELKTGKRIGDANSSHRAQVSAAWGGTEGRGVGEVGGSAERG